ncbi:MAG: GAF domain-containing protein [Burkholderiales bacterium]
MNAGLPSQEPAALCLPFEVCAALCETVPQARTLDEALHAIETVRGNMLGPGLLTVNLRCDEPPLAARASTFPSLSSDRRSDRSTIVELRRIWSSDTLAYPVAARKQKTWTAWTHQLFQRGEVFIGEGAGALADAFDDHARIASLGLRAVVNVPLLDVSSGAPFATFNVLSQRDRWQPQEVWLIRLLASIAMPAIAHEARSARA